MNARTGFDAGPLSWVKAEIDQSLKSAGEALRDFAASGDASKLAAGAAFFHQAHGALQIVGLDGVIRVSEEVEGLLSDLSRGAVASGEVSARAIDAGLAGLSGYLDQLTAGATHQPLRLFSVYRQLIAARAAGDAAAANAADPADLYFPDLSARPPRREKIPVQLHPEEAPKYMRDQRARYQRGFLKWLKASAERKTAADDSAGQGVANQGLADMMAGAQDMAGAVQAIELIQGFGPQRSFWWAAQAFFEALIEGALPPELDARRVSNRVEAQIRRLVEGSQNVAERLMREVLYGVALARPATDLIAEVQEVFKLAGSVPGADEKPVAAQLKVGPPRELLRQSQEAWKRAANSKVGGKLEIGELAALAQRLADATGALGEPESAQLALDVASVARWVTEDVARMSEVVTLEAATALLLLENAFQHLAEGGGVDPAFAEQRRFVSARLEAAMQGNLLRTAPDNPLLEEMSRQAQESLVTDQVVGEMQAGLRVVEQVLDGFFRDPSRRGELATLAQPLQQLLASLDTLGETRARDVLAMCAQGINRYMEPGYAPPAGDFEATAQALSGLGFYFQALREGQADFDQAMRPLSADAGGAKARADAERAEDGMAAGDETASVEAQLEQQREKARGLFAQWKKRPTDTLLRDELQRELNAIQKDAVLVGDAALEARAGEALAALANVEAQPAEAQAAAPTLAQAVGELDSAAQAPAPSAQVARLIDASKEAVDAELLGIYLEEASEVLEHIGESLARLHAEHANADAMTALRRSFHTLKGSGRMVGLTRLANAAWGIEQTLGQRLELGMPAATDLLGLLEAGRAYFTDNVARLKDGGSSSDEAPLMAMVEAVRAAQSGAQPATTAGADTGAIASSNTSVARGKPVPRDAKAAQQGAPVIDFGSLPQSAGAQDDGGSVDLGGERISINVFTLFSGEVHAHLSTLRAEHDTMVNHGIVTDEMLRAAHTMVGLAGSVKLETLRELALAFEDALTQLAADTLSEVELALVDEAIEELDTMVTAAVAMRLPRPAPELVVRLRNASATRMVADLNPDDILLPEEEAALPRDPLPAVAVPAAVPAAAASLAAVPVVATPGPQQASTTDPGGTPAERPRERARDDIDAQMLPIFLEEADELMPAIGGALRTWREAAELAGGDAVDAVELRGQALQRLLHTFKGSARMSGAMALGEVAHHMETRIDAALAASARPVTETQPVVARLNTLFGELETAWDRAGALYEALRSPGQQTETAPADAASDADNGEDVAKAVLVRDGEALHSMLRVRADMVDRLVDEAGEVSIARSRIESEMRTLKSSIGELTDNVARLRSQLREVEFQAETQMQARARQRPLEGEQAAGNQNSAQFDPLEFDRFTRLQELTRMMAESVNDVQTVHQNLLAGMHGVDTALAAQARLSRDLQHDLLRVRMVALDGLAERLHRVVRSTARELGKRASLDIHGAAVELDRSVLERITPAIEHLLRNAVMHGIEAPAARVQAGKPGAGEIRLELSQQGNEVRIELSDDGAGLDLERIRSRALDRGLLQPGAVASDAELADFIFVPGFTTAEQLTQIAGRGVGMDVVRSVVQGLGGRVEISSQRGSGVKNTIHLPLTLAITQSVLARAGTRQFAIPSAMVEHVLQYRPGEVRELRAAGFMDWQGRRYPLARLSVLVGEARGEDNAPDPAGADESNPENQRRSAPVLLVKSGASALALEVEELAAGNQEIVVKATGPHLQRVAGVTGATVLGSGEIVLIIDPLQLNAHFEAAVHSAGAEDGGDASGTPAAQVIEPARIMVVDDSLTVRKITGRLLERQGYEVVTAKDGVEAMEKLQADGTLPVVMLVDIEMPRMDGFELARQVRADARLAGVPIIIISSRNADKHRGHAAEIGVNDFLGKPYQEDELLAKIGEFEKARG